MVLLMILSVFESHQSEDGKPNEMQFSYLILWNALSPNTTPTVVLVAHSLSQHRAIVGLQRNKAASRVWISARLLCSRELNSTSVALCWRTFRLRTWYNQSFPDYANLPTMSHHCIMVNKINP